MGLKPRPMEESNFHRPRPLGEVRRPSGPTLWGFWAAGRVGREGPRHDGTILPARNWKRTTGEWDVMWVRGTDSSLSRPTARALQPLSLAAGRKSAGWRSRGSDILEDAVGWRRGGASVGPCMLIEGTAAHGTRGTLCVPEILYAVYRHPLRTGSRGGPCLSRARLQGR